LIEASVTRMIGAGSFAAEKVPGMNAMRDGSQACGRAAVVGSTLLNGGETHGDTQRI